MNEIIHNLTSTNMVAFAMTYLLHSSVWILVVALLLKTPFLQIASLKNNLWKLALIGGLASAIFTFFGGNVFWEIPLNAPIAEKIAPTEKLIIESSFTKTELQEHNTPIISNEIPTAPILSEPLSSINYWNILLIIWLSISLFLFTKLLIEHWLFFQNLSPRIPITDSKVIGIFKSLQNKAKLNPSIKLTQSNRLDSPILIRNKEICLPQRAILKMEKEQLEAMIAHELAHIARKDYYWNCGLALLQILFFFQPLHRLAQIEINNTNELLCDAYAARITGNNIALAQCLITVASWIKERPVNYAMVSRMSLKKSELSKRIYSLTQFSENEKSEFNKLKTSLLSAIILISILVVLPAFSFSIQKETNDLVLVNPLPALIDLSSPVIETPSINEIASSPIDPPENKVPSTNVEEKSKIPKRWHTLTDEKFESLSNVKKECAYLIAAIIDNKPSKTKRLLETSNPNCKFCGSLSAASPINTAARLGNVAMTKLLLESGADLYTKSIYEEGALIAAARTGNVELMKLLDKYGAYFNHEFGEHGTPLTNAIDHNRYDMVKYLLDRNADPFMKLSNGKTAIDYAKAKGGRMEKLFINSL